MKAEVLLVNTAENFSEQTEVREASDRELEARAIAARIKQLVGAHPVFDKKSGAYRPAKYSDIVILTRSLKGWTDVFTEVLNREGIPTFTGSKEGYFETREIRLLLDYLRVLDNPRQDLPLAAVLNQCLQDCPVKSLPRSNARKRKYLFMRRCRITGGWGTTEQSKKN